MLYWLAFLSSAEPVKRFRTQLTMLDPSFNASDQWKWESGCQKNNPWKAYRFEYEFTESSNKSFNQKRRSNFRFFYFQLTKAHHLAKFRRSFICTRSPETIFPHSSLHNRWKIGINFRFFFFCFCPGHSLQVLVWKWTQPTCKFSIKNYVLWPYLENRKFESVFV